MPVIQVVRKPKWTGLNDSVMNINFANMTKERSESVMGYAEEECHPSLCHKPLLETRLKAHWRQKKNRLQICVTDVGTLETQISMSSHW